MKRDAQDDSFSLRTHLDAVALILDTLTLPFEA